MESEDNEIIYTSADKLVRVLKKRYKSCRDVIRKNTSRQQRFAIVTIKRCTEVDKCANYYRTNGNCDELDKRLRDIAADERPAPNKKSRLSANAPELNLRQINDENDELDFDEDELFKKPMSRPNEASGLERSDATNSKSKLTKKFANNKNNNNQRPTDGISFLSNEFQNINFKIPKRVLNEKDANKSVESVVNMVNTINMNNANRCVDAFEQLSRYLNDSHWENNEVLKILAKISIGLASNIENSGHVDKLESVIVKLKKGGYVDNDFWDELISLIEKRKTTGKCLHQLNLFLAHIYDFMLQRKIRVRLINSESVIAAYRNFSTYQPLN